MATSQASPHTATIRNTGLTLSADVVVLLGAIFVRCLQRPIDML